jgi:hypothetical protein
MKNKSKNKQEYKTLLSALAFGATDDSQKILAQNNIPEAKTYEELEVKLAKLYSDSTDKIKLEKKFAEIHPHSKFILKYLAPKQEERPEVIETLKSEVAQPQIVEVKSNASGCGCSSAEGETEKTKINMQSLALVSIVAIVGLVIITKR